MSFGAPEWLTSLPFVAYAAWRWPRLELWRPMRLGCLALLSFALAEPRLARWGRGLDVWLLLDRSSSARDLIEPRRAELEALLDRSRSPDDRLLVVDFAEAAALRNEAAGWSPRGSETRIASAVRFALGRLAPDRAARLLLVTDGFSTEPLQGLAERLVAHRTPLDLRRIGHDTTGDYRVASVQMPQRILLGEPFVIEARVMGSPDGIAPVTVRRDNEPIGRSTVQLEEGFAVVRFTDAIRRAGAYNYAVRVEREGDKLPGNNEAEAWIEVAAGPRVVLVTAYTDDPLAAVLGSQGLLVDTITAPERLSVGRLSGARLLVLNNVPAHRLPAAFVSAIDAYVRVQGGGLVMFGGPSSFGAGGYFGTSVDPILPVSMELRQEHRKLAVAMAIVLDRSGSMAVDVGGGLTKMDLANAGAARSIELLGANDGVSVFAVDSEAHRIIPLSLLGEERERLVDIVRRIQSAGGGIFVYAGLKAAWEELKAAPYGQRHLILFADAADAEEPGDYRRLLEEVSAAGCTVSVIGLGSGQDTDAEFLKDVAARGKGRLFFAEHPASVPAIFAQETVTVARSAFIDDATPTRGGSGWLELAARPMEWPASVDGYNLSYLKDGASAALISQDEYEAPLVAFWQRGSGRAAAVSFPVGGPAAGRARAWVRYSDFVQTLARWAAGSELPQDIGLKTRREGTQLAADLWFDASWEERLATKPPQLLLVEGESGEAKTVPWERISPGHMRARAELQPGSWYRGAAQIGQSAFPFGPVGVPSSVEWAMEPSRIQELRALSAASGGRDINDLASIWKDRDHATPRDLRPLLLLLLLALFLAEALRVRLGLAAEPLLEAGHDAPEGAAPAPSVSEPVPSVAGHDSERRRRRFRRAKRGW